MQIKEMLTEPLGPKELDIYLMVTQQMQLEDTMVLILIKGLTEMQEHH